MTVMTTGHALIPTGRPFTVEDLSEMPDDGNRYELIDGMLIVSPAPRWQHQEMGEVVGDEPYEAQRPFPVTIVAARLLDGTRP